MAPLHGDTVLQDGGKLDDAMAAATLTLVISSLWHDGLGGFRVTISEIETTNTRSLILTMQELPGIMSTRALVQLKGRS